MSEATTADLDDDELVFARPELVVADLLRRALTATQRSLAAQHSRLDDAGPAARDLQLARIIVAELRYLDALLADYARIVATRWAAVDDDPPF
jgi:hypothetical protein